MRTRNVRWDQKDRVQSAINPKGDHLLTQHSLVNRVEGLCKFECASFQLRNPDDRLMSSLILRIPLCFLFRTMHLKRFHVLHCGCTIQIRCNISGAWLNRGACAVLESVSTFKRRSRWYSKCNILRQDEWRASARLSDLKHFSVKRHVLRATHTMVTRFSHGYLSFEKFYVVPAAGNVRGHSFKFRQTFFLSRQVAFVVRSAAYVRLKKI